MYKTKEIQRVNIPSGYVILMQIINDNQKRHSFLKLLSQSSIPVISVHVFKISTDRLIRVRPVAVKSLQSFEKENTKTSELRIDKNYPFYFGPLFNFKGIPGLQNPWKYDDFNGRANWKKIIKDRFSSLHQTARMSKWIINRSSEEGFIFNYLHKVLKYENHCAITHIIHHISVRRTVHTHIFRYNIYVIHIMLKI